MTPREQRLRDALEMRLLLARRTGKTSKHIAKLVSQMLCAHRVMNTGSYYRCPFCGASTKIPPGMNV